MNIVILYACGDNPFARSFRSINHGLAKMDEPTGTIVAYATSPGSSAADGTKENGLYTSMLLKHIKTP
ncbi:MAG: caspase family protein [Deltaproteobacteria bacterium]|nr:caspase family protein [Deltaproteobacteria bacterium]